MAHFAEINENNRVLRVVVVANEELKDSEGIEHENLGQTFCQSLFGGSWLQTSYNGNIRKNFAGIGHTYDENLNAFIAPQSFPSYLFNEDSCVWEPPTPMPRDNKFYRWDEDTTSWVELT